MILKFFKRYILIFFVGLFILSACSKERKVTKHFEGVWIATEILENGDPKDMSKIKIELDFFSNTSTKYTAFAELEREEEFSFGTQFAEYDVALIASENAKNITFIHQYGTLNEFYEEYEIVKLNRKKLVIKRIGSEIYFTYEKLKDYND
jgi:hypothetical protein